MYQCPGCGTEVENFRQMCNNCSQKVTCQCCGRTYVRGTGILEYDICSQCEINSDDTLVEDVAEKDDVVLLSDPYMEYGFDHFWEL